MTRLGRLWRSFRTAAWLGWQIESNWTDPFLFVVYTVAKPLALSGILVLMYAAVTKGDFRSPVFSYIYLGNAFYMYVGAVMTGMAFAVIDDRERYRMLKSIYVAPVDFRLYLVGRGVARFLTGSVAVFITIVTGVLFLHVDVRPLSVNWVLFVTALALGMVMLAALGLLIGSVVLLLTHQSWSVGDAVAGGLFLFSGAVFPIDRLPAFLRPIGFGLPILYWLELLRRALIGPAQAFPTLAGMGNGQLFGMLAVLTLILGAVSLVVFGRCDHAARERGLIDRTSNY
jgi:ABC-2 type transport system permease protein